MAINKVVLHNEDGTEKTLVDLTGDTVTAENVKSGVKFHDKTGWEKSGTLPEQMAQVKLVSVPSAGSYNFYPLDKKIITDLVNITAYFKTTRKDIRITSNGSYTVNNDDPSALLGGVDIDVNVPTTIKTKPLDVVNNGVYPVPDGFTGWGTVNVNVPTTGSAEVHPFVISKIDNRADPIITIPLIDDQDFPFGYSDDLSAPNIEMLLGKSIKTIGNSGIVFSCSATSSGGAPIAITPEFTPGDFEAIGYSEAGMFYAGNGDIAVFRPNRDGATISFTVDSV